jgi:membrane protein implicated in regulation of membrane protease activity
MDTVYLVGAGLGGAVVVCQFIAGALGFGGDHHDVDGHDASHGHHEGDGTGASSWFVGLLTVKTVSAALTFFGLAGLAMQSNGAETWLTLLVASASGLAALVMVAQLMKWLYRLKSDHTIKIDRAVGQDGRVYLTVPAARNGAGKVTVTVQGRSVEFQAVTAANELPSGARVTVVAIAAPGVLEVVPATSG